MGRGLGARSRPLGTVSAVITGIRPKHSTKPAHTSASSAQDVQCGTPYFSEESLF